jgi:TolB-like protein
MKNLLLLILSFLLVEYASAQTMRLAILDFENISGIAKYDGLGKAMSSMLISDIEANVSPKRLQLVERAQIQKVLKEQNFQASGSVNKNTAVQAGKLLGVNYLLIGDVYILNDELIINARLTNTETGDIVFSKKQEGKTVGWLTLKTNIAKDLASSLTQPFTEPTIPDKEIALATLTTFGNAITAKDVGDTSLAGKLVETVQEFSPEFKYLDDLKVELDEIKKQVAQNTKDIKKINEEVIDNVTDYLNLGYKYSLESNFVGAEKYFLIGLNKVDKTNIVEYLEYNFALAQLYYNNKKYDQAIEYSNSGLSVYPYFKEFIYFKYMSLGKLNRLDEFDQIVNYSKEIENEKGDNLIVSKIKKYASDNRVNYYDIEKYYLAWKQDPFTTLKKAVRYNGEFHFNLNYEKIPLNELIVTCIHEVYNIDPSKAVLLLKKLDLTKMSEDLKGSLAWYTMLSGDYNNAKKQFSDIVINSFWRTSDCSDFSPAIPYENLGKIDYKSSFLIKIPDEKKDQYRGSIHRYYYPDKDLILIDKYEGRKLLEYEKDSIRLKKPYWYYENNEGLGFITTNPIEAYIFKVNNSFPLNALIECINSSNCIAWSSVSEKKKMSLINWGHAYLLSGDLDIALKIYKLFPLDYNFGEDFGHAKVSQVIMNDFQEFENGNLISTGKISEARQKLFN